MLCEWRANSLGLVHTQRVVIIQGVGMVAGYSGSCLWHDSRLTFQSHRWHHNCLSKASDGFTFHFQVKFDFLVFCVICSLLLCCTFFHPHQPDQPVVLSIPCILQYIPSLVLCIGVLSDYVSHDLPGGVCVSPTCPGETFLPAQI